MHRLITMTTIALIALAAPLATQLRADDAHHPDKAAKAKKPAKAKTNRPKKPPQKTGGVSISWQERKT